VIVFDFKLVALIASFKTEGFLVEGEHSIIKISFARESNCSGERFVHLPGGLLWRSISILVELEAESNFVFVTSATDFSTIRQHHSAFAAVEMRSNRHERERLVLKKLR